MNKEKKIRSLKWKFAKIMLLCWVLPFLVIIGLIGSYMLITQRENQMERLSAQAGLNTRTCAERLNGAISDSRQATYDGLYLNSTGSIDGKAQSESAFFPMEYRIIWTHSIPIKK